MGTGTHDRMDEKAKLSSRKDWIEHVPPKNGRHCAR